MKRNTLALTVVLGLSAGSAFAQGGMPGAIMASSQPHPQLSLVQQNDDGPLAWLHGLFRNRDRSTETSHLKLPAEVRTPDRAHG
ncbi:MAG: hypothetical protein M3Y41_07625 [Pseudomonadota bacterium]|nr:hypothetical protein [Pseudomonadota bacterium]